MVRLPNLCIYYYFSTLKDEPPICGCLNIIVCVICSNAVPPLYVHTHPP